MIKKMTNYEYVKNLLDDVANEFFSGSTQLRAFRDIPIKSRYISNLFLVTEEISLDLTNSQVLDVGCSKCDVLLALRRLGLTNLTGINLFPYDLNWLSNAQDYELHFGNSDDKIKYLVCDVDVEPFPFKDSCYDVVLLLDVLEHLNDPQHVLSECARVLSSGGLIVIGTPNAANLKNRLYAVLGRSTYSSIDSFLEDGFRVEREGFRRFTGHVREYTMDELNYVMKVFGFQVLLKHYYPSAINSTSVSYRLYNAFERIYSKFGYHMMIIGQKKLHRMAARFCCS